MTISWGCGVNKAGQKVKCGNSFSPQPWVICRGSFEIGHHRISMFNTILHQNSTSGTKWWAN